MKKEFVEELKAQLEDHDEVVVVDSGDGLICEVEDIRWNSQDGRVEITVSTGK